MHGRPNWAQNALPGTIFHFRIEIAILIFFRIKFGLFRVEIFLKMVPSLSINAQFKGKPWEFFFPTKDQASWGCLSPEIQQMIYTENFAQNFGMAKKRGNNMEPTFLSSFWLSGFRSVIRFLPKNLVPEIINWLALVVHNCTLFWRGFWGLIYATQCNGPL